MTKLIPFFSASLMKSSTLTFLKYSLYFSSKLMLSFPFSCNITSFRDAYELFFSYRQLANCFIAITGDHLKLTVTTNQSVTFVAANPVYCIRKKIPRIFRPNFAFKCFAPYPIRYFQNQNDVFLQEGFENCTRINPNSRLYYCRTLVFPMLYCPPSGNMNFLKEIHPVPKHLFASD